MTQKDTFDSEVDEVLEDLLDGFLDWLGRPDGVDHATGKTNKQYFAEESTATRKAKTKLRQIIKDRLPEKIVEFDTFSMLNADAGYRKGYNQAISDVISALGLEDN